MVSGSGRAATITAPGPRPTWRSKCRRAPLLNSRSMRSMRKRPSPNYCISVSWMIGSFGGLSMLIWRSSLPSLESWFQLRMQQRTGGQHAARVEIERAAVEVGEHAAGLFDDHGQRGHIEDVDVGFDHRVQRAARQQVVVEKIAVA